MGLQLQSLQTLSGPCRFHAERGPIPGAPCAMCVVWQLSRVNQVDGRIAPDKLQTGSWFAQSRQPCPYQRSKKPLERLDGHRSIPCQLNNPVGLHTEDQTDRRRQGGRVLQKATQERLSSGQLKQRSSYLLARGQNKRYGSTPEMNVPKISTWLSINTGKPVI